MKINADELIKLFKNHQEKVKCNNKTMNEVYALAFEHAIDIVNFMIKKEQITMNLYDEEETHENCTVQVLRNTVTGDISVGWWENE